MNSTSCGCEVGQQRREIAGALDHRAGGGAEPDPQLARDDLRQRRLAEPGRTEEQHVVERFAAAFRGVDKDAQIVAQLALADELVERQRPDRGFGRVLLDRFGATMRGAASFTLAPFAGELLEPGADQRIDRGAVAEPLARRGDHRGKASTRR